MHLELKMPRGQQIVISNDPRGALRSGRTQIPLQGILAGTALFRPSHTVRFRYELSSQP
jgi:hypothetical protein